MKPADALNQLCMCAHGQCETCVHQEEECYSRIEEMRRTLLAELIIAASAKEVANGTFMNQPE